MFPDALPFPFTLLFLLHSPLPSSLSIKRLLLERIVEMDLVTLLTFYNDCSYGKSNALLHRGHQASSSSEGYPRLVGLEHHQFWSISGSDQQESDHSDIDSFRWVTPSTHCNPSTTKGIYEYFCFQSWFWMKIVFVLYLVAGENGGKEWTTNLCCIVLFPSFGFQDKWRNWAPLNKIVVQIKWRLLPSKVLNNYCCFGFQENEKIVVRVIGQLLLWLISNFVFSCSK